MSDLEYSDTEEFSYSNDGGPDPKRHARTQHNELERRRRNNIKDMYNALKDSIPGMQNDRASRAVILKKAVELITNKKLGLEECLDEVKELESQYLELQKELAALQSDTDYPQSPSREAEIVYSGEANEHDAVSHANTKRLFNHEANSAFDNYVPSRSTMSVSSDEYADITNLS